MDIASVLAGSISRMSCTATVLHNPAVGDAADAIGRNTMSVLQHALPSALGEGLAARFASDTVVVVRAVSCTASVHLVTGSSAPENLSWQLAAQLAHDVGRQVRGDGSVASLAAARPDVITFTSTADFVAEYLAHRVLNGSVGRWYFEPFSGYDGQPLGDVIADLNRGLPGVMVAAWQLLQVSGRLAPVLLATDDAVVDIAWRADTPARPDDWLALGHLTMQLIEQLRWPLRPALTASVLAGELASRADTDLDWAAGRRMAQAVLTATRLALDPAVRVPGPAPTIDRLASWDWLDTGALAEGLQALCGDHGRRAGDAGSSSASAGRRTSPDCAMPAPTPHALAARPPVPTPRRSEVRQLGQRLLAGPDVVVVPGRPATVAAQLWSAIVGLRPDLADQSWARNVVRAIAEEAVVAAEPTPERVTVLAGHLEPPTSVPEAEPATAQNAIGQGVWAGALLLLRSLDALRIPARCRTARVEPAWLLRQLLVRWSGASIDAPGLDAVVQVLAGPFETAGDEDRSALRDVVRGVRAAGPNSPAAPVGPEDLAALKADGSSSDVDELAVLVLRHWTSWLRGFSASTIPYVLEMFVRRPGLVRQPNPTRLVVHLPPRPHDVVLAISGYLDPFEPVWSWTGHSPVSIEIRTEA